MLRVFDSYSQPIRFARFDRKSVNRRLATKPGLSIPAAGQKGNAALGQGGSSNLFMHISQMSITRFNVNVPD